MSLHNMLHMLAGYLEKDEEYSCKILVPGRGICGLQRMIFTVGLCYNIDEMGNYEGRYCFHTYSEAAESLRNWNGTSDPSGNWLKHKGRTEYSNLNYSKDE